MYSMWNAPSDRDYYDPYGLDDHLAELVDDGWVCRKCLCSECECDDSAPAEMRCTLCNTVYEYGEPCPTCHPRVTVTIPPVEDEDCPF